MTDIFDLVPAATEVAVGDKTIGVYALSIGVITGVIQRYPAIMDAVQKRLGNGGSVSYAELALLLGPATGAFIAAGLGHAGDKEREAAADKLPIDMQIELVAGILEVTVGEGGIGPFVDRLKVRMEALAQKFAPPEPKVKGKMRSLRSREPVSS